MTLGRLNTRLAAATMLIRGPVNLVEYAAVFEVRRLYLRPAAELLVVNGDELNFRKALHVLRVGLGRIGRPVIVPGRQLLTLIGVEVVEIGPRHFARALR